MGATGTLLTLGIIGIAAFFLLKVLPGATGAGLFSFGADLQRALTGGQTFEESLQQGANKPIILPTQTSTIGDTFLQRSTLERLSAQDNTRLRRSR